MEELTREEKLKAWEKCLNHFKRFFLDEGYTGICVVIKRMHYNFLLLNNEAYYLRDEVASDIAQKGINDKWLFEIYDYESRLEYLENKVLKYTEGYEISE